MIGRKIVLSLAAIAGCAAAALLWDGAVQPQAMSQQALRQMEFHTDGSGSRAAAQRRMLCNSLAVPVDLVMGVCGMGLVIAIWSDRKRAPASEATRPQNQGEQQ
jgi:hypothetical protein